MSRAETPLPVPAPDPMLSLRPSRVVRGGRALGLVALELVGVGRGRHVRRWVHERLDDDRGGAEVACDLLDAPVALLLGASDAHQRAVADPIARGTGSASLPAAGA